MKSFLVLAAASILGVCLIAGCGVETYSDPEKTISVSVNQEFTITLRITPRLGHKWVDSHDDNMLALVESTYESDDKLRPVSGTRYFRFKALETGKTQITFTKRHGTTGPVQEQKVFNVDIN